MPGAFVRPDDVMGCFMRRGLSCGRDHAVHPLPMVTVTELTPLRHAPRIDRCGSKLQSLLPFFLPQRKAADLDCTSSATLAATSPPWPHEQPNKGLGRGGFVSLVVSRSAVAFALGPHCPSSPRTNSHVGPGWSSAYGRPVERRTQNPELRALGTLFQRP